MKEFIKQALINERENKTAQTMLVAVNRIFKVPMQRNKDRLWKYESR